MTKRRDIIKKIKAYAKANGLDCVIKEGSNHTRIWVGDRYTTLGRHNEIDNIAARKLFKQIGINDD